MSGSECNKPVQTQFLLELRMSILRRRCSFGVFIARCWFPVDNTDMLRWSCRRRGWRGEHVSVCVCVIEEPVYFQFRWQFKCHLHSPSKEIVVLHSASSVFFFFFFFTFSVHFCSFWPPFLGSSATLWVRPLLLCSHSAEVFDKSWAGMTGGDISGSRKLHAKTGAPWSEERSRHVLAR